MRKVYHTQQLPLFPSKICAICHNEKLLDLFPPSKQVKDGHDTRCRICRDEYMAQYRKKHHEKLKAYDRFRGVSPERKQEKLRSERIKRRSNPEYAKANRERLTQWKTKHPYASREQSMRQHARLYGVIVEVVDYEHILKRDGLICHICEEAVVIDNLQFDHVIPPSRGGSHTFGNIKVAHAICNVRKGNLLMEELEQFHRKGPILY